MRYPQVLVMHAQLQALNACSIWTSHREDVAQNLESVSPGICFRVHNIATEKSKNNNPDSAHKEENFRQVFRQYPLHVSKDKSSEYVQKAIMEIITDKITI